MQQRGQTHVVVTAMAVRSYKVEGPILEDVHEMAQIIKKSLKNVPGNYKETTKNYFGVGAARNKPRYISTLEELGASEELVKKYGTLIVVIEPGGNDSLGTFYRPQPGIDAATISLTYSPAMIDDSVVNYESAFRGLSQTIEHELRHYVDFATGIGKKSMENKGREASYSDYYNLEHELDARLTALFINIARLIRGSALLALKNKIDSMSKKHHELLKNGEDNFYRFLLSYDNSSKHNAMVQYLLNDTMKKEAEGKCKEFYKYLFEKYAMALKAVKKEDVTPAMKKAWADLHKESSRNDETAIKKIVG